MSESEEQNLLRNQVNELEKKIVNLEKEISDKMVIIDLIASGSNKLAQLENYNDISNNLATLNDQIIQIQSSLEVLKLNRVNREILQQIQDHNDNFLYIYQDIQSLKSEVKINDYFDNVSNDLIELKDEISKIQDALKVLKLSQHSLQQSQTARLHELVQRIENLPDFSSDLIILNNEIFQIQNEFQFLNKSIYAVITRVVEENSKDFQDKLNQLQNSKNTHEGYLHDIGEQRYQDLTRNYDRKFSMLEKELNHFEKSVYSKTGTVSLVFFILSNIFVVSLVLNFYFLDLEKNNQHQMEGIKILTPNPGN